MIKTKSPQNTDGFQRSTEGGTRDGSGRILSTALNLGFVWLTVWPVRGADHCLGVGVSPPGPYKALGGVVHEAQLEPLLVPEALRQRVPDVIRG